MNPFETAIQNIIYTLVVDNRVHMKTHRVAPKKKLPKTLIDFNNFDNSVRKVAETCADRYKSVLQQRSELKNKLKGQITNDEHDLISDELYELEGDNFYDFIDFVGLNNFYNIDDDLKSDYLEKFWDLFDEKFVPVQEDQVVSHAGGVVDLEQRHKQLFGESSKFSDDFLLL